MQENVSVYGGVDLTLDKEPAGQRFAVSMSGCSRGSSFQHRGIQSCRLRTYSVESYKPYRPAIQSMLMERSRIGPCHLKLLAHAEDLAPLPGPSSR